MSTEVIYLRVDPATKAVLLEQVVALNKVRKVSEPEYTLQSFVLRCVQQAITPDLTALKIGARSKRARRK